MIPELLGADCLERRVPSHVGRDERGQNHRRIAVQRKREIFEQAERVPPGPLVRDGLCWDIASLDRGGKSVRPTRIVASHPARIRPRNGQSGNGPLRSVEELAGRNPSVFSAQTQDLLKFSPFLIRYLGGDQGEQQPDAKRRGDEVRSIGHDLMESAPVGGKRSNDIPPPCSVMVVPCRIVRAGDRRCTLWSLRQRRGRVWRRFDWR